MAIVRYLVRDVGAAVPFYEALGFTAGERWSAPFVMLARGDLVLWLSGPGTSAARPLGSGAQPEPGGWNRLVIDVSDLDTAMAPLHAIGAHARGEPAQGPGGRHLVVNDPSGNPIELFEAKA